MTLNCREAKKGVGRQPHAAQTAFKKAVSEPNAKHFTIEMFSLSLNFFLYTTQTKRYPQWLNGSSAC